MWHKRKSGGVDQSHKKLSSGAYECLHKIFLATHPVFYETEPKLQPDYPADWPSIEPWCQCGLKKKVKHFQYAVLTYATVFVLHAVIVDAIISIGVSITLLFCENHKLIKTALFSTLWQCIFFQIMGFLYGLMVEWLRRCSFPNQQRQN